MSHILVRPLCFILKSNLIDNHLFTKTQFVNTNKVFRRYTILYPTVHGYNTRNTLVIAVNTTIGDESITTTPNSVNIENIVIDKKTTNKYKRSLISVYENRRIPVAMGLLGSLLIAFVLFSLLFTDIPVCFQHFKRFANVQYKK